MDYVTGFLPKASPSKGKHEPRDGSSIAVRGNWQRSCKVITKIGRYILLRRCEQYSRVRSIDQPAIIEIVPTSWIYDVRENRLWKAWYGSLESQGG